MRKIETRALVEASLLSALAAVAVIISVSMPIFSIVGGIIFPVCITYVAFKHDIRISIMSLFVSVVLSSIIVGPVQAGAVGLQFGITAIVLGYCLQKKYSPFITIIAMSVATFIGYIAMLKLSTLFMGVDILKEITDTFNESLKDSIKIMKSMGATDAQISNSNLKEITPQMLRTFLPGALIVGSIMSSYIVYIIVGLVFKRLRITIRGIKPLDQWYIGDYTSFGLLSITMLSLILYYLKVPNADIVYSSMYMLLLFVFVVIGISVVVWFLKSRGIPRGVQILIIVFLVFSQMLIVLCFLGLLDFIIDFRKINPARRGRISPKE